MKANEAPEKIYIQCFNVREEDAKFDKSKMFFDDVWTEEPEPGQENIEYVRKDAFIEKAAEWIKNKAERYIVDTPLCSYFDYKRAVEDFRNYMKEE